MELFCKSLFVLCVQIISDVWWKIEIDMHAKTQAVAAWKEMHTLCVIANKCLIYGDKTSTLSRIYVLIRVLIVISIKLQIMATTVLAEIKIKFLQCKYISPWWSLKD